MDNFPQVEADFVIEGKKLDLDMLTKKLDMIPTETKAFDDWPEVIKCSKDIPPQLQPRCVWSICRAMDSCKQIDRPIRDIIAQIRGKEEGILEFCKKNELRKCLCMTIHAEAMNLPEMVIPPDIVSYFGKLETEISFDIYTY